MLSFDNIKVFVSSTIKECLQERQKARDAIKSINHHPVLFENFGARPHPPRTMYQRGIEESSIFIGIYRDSYGYVADGMTISGVEDEYRLASGRAVPRLIYVREDAKERQPRLNALILEIMNSGGVTVATYSQPSDLYDLIRNDLTALISETFLSADPQEQNPLPPPSSILESLISNPAHRLRRLEVERAIVDLASNNVHLNVSGPLGSGKTILLLLLANERGWIYLNGHARSEMELLSQAANALRQVLGHPPLGITRIDVAQRAFVEAWKATSSVSLVIDGLDDSTLGAVLEMAMPSTPNKRLIISTRNPIKTVSLAHFEIPKLVRHEVATVVGAIRGEHPSANELDELITRSDGNYLYLRYYASGDPGKFESDIKNYELREWQALPAQTREALTYIVLADFPLTLKTLHSLLGDKNASIETTLAILGRGSHLLRVTESSYELFHEHFRQTIYELVHSISPQHKYYASRLGDVLNDLGDPLSAFFVFDQAGDQKALKIVDKALFQAAYSGDVSRGIRVSERRVALAREHSEQQELVASLLSLAQFKQQNGDNTGALEVLVQAKAEAQASADPSWLMFVREKELSMRAWSSGSPDSIQQLLVLRDEYEAKSDTYGAARVSLDISVAYIRCANHIEAEVAARSALGSFQKLGDDHGVAAAKSNLLSALSGLPEKKRDADALLAEISEQSDPVEMPRQRAFLCNVYSRRHREQGNYDLAIKFSKEALEIGEALGDAHVIALNQLNMGNAYRDKDNLEEALARYIEASKKASTAKIVHLEAAASESIAQIHNLTDDPKKALLYSTYAIALAQDISDHKVLARSYRERAKANVSLNRRYDAITDYLSAARALSDSSSGQGLRLDLIEEGLWLVAEEGAKNLIGEFIDLLLPGKFTSSSGLTPQDTLYQKLSDLVSRVPINRTFGVSGLIFRFIFSGIPPLYAKRTMSKIIEKLKPSSNKAFENRKLVFWLATLLTSVPTKHLTIANVVEVAENISELVEGLYVKPRSDGSLHVTLNLNFDKPVICTIGQIDDRVDIAVASLVLALLLKGLEREIQTQILLVDSYSRSEVMMQVVNVNELAAQVDNAHLARAGLELPMKDVCSVTRSADPTSLSLVPMIVICRDDLADGWQPGYRKGGSLQIMLGLVLVELVYSLFDGQVDFEALRPKIVSVVQRTMS